MKTVHELRKSGHEVRVYHRRCHTKPNTFGKITLCSKGGSTEVSVDGVSGFADCCMIDNYNKRLGVHIALGRALKRLGIPTK